MVSQSLTILPLYSSPSFSSMFPLVCKCVSVCVSVCVVYVSVLCLSLSLCVRVSVSVCPCVWVCVCYILKCFVCVESVSIVVRSVSKTQRHFFSFRRWVLPSIVPNGRGCLFISFLQCHSIVVHSDPCLDILNILSMSICIHSSPDVHCSTTLTFTVSAA